jgi:hypothetical protein
MDFAKAEPEATRKPIVKRSAFTIKAAFEAISMLDGPMKGIMFKKKDVTRMPKSSYRVANHFNLFFSTEIINYPLKLLS